MGAFLVLAGVVFAGYAESSVVKCYTITAALIFGAMFATVGAVIHLRVYQKIKRTTIKRPEGWGK